MTEPDDGLEDALRQAMSAASDEVAPGSDGLSKIRVKIRNRPPRPWLLSVLAGWADRARNWTWRGHWAWPSSLRWPAAFSAPRGRPTPRPGLTGARTRAGNGSLRLGAVLVGIAAIAAASVGVQPFRHAIIQASSTVFNDGSGAKDGGGGTDSNGTRALGSSVANFSTTHPAGLGAASTVPGPTRSAAAQSTPAEKCGPATAIAESTSTVGRPASGDATATLTRSPSTTAAVPAASSVASDSDTVKTTCPMSTATPTPTTSPTPTATPTPTTSPTPSVSSTSSTPLILETTPTPTPTAVATTPSTVYTWPTPTEPPAWSHPTHAPRQQPAAAGTGGSTGGGRHRR